MGVHDCVCVCVCSKYFFVSQAAKETRKESQSSADRLQQMVLMLHSTLAENTNFMEALVEELDEAGVEYRVAERGPAGSVRWKRKHRERTVTADAQVHVHIVWMVHTFSSSDII